MDTITEAVKEYYGKVLNGTKDLKTQACCCVANSYPAAVKEALELIDDEIVSHYYGCGSPIPPLLDGITALDLGCGSGRDVYVVARLAGEKGHVIGVDMTEEQLAIARRHEDEQRRRFGYAKSNVEFIQGYIEDLKSAGIADNSVDLVISNCVINLSPYKQKIFDEIWRVLKPGGEFYFSDVFADRRIPEALSQDPVLHGECISGAMYYEDFRRMMAKSGFADFRYMSVRRLDLDNREIVNKVGFAAFTERTVRAFKLADLEDRCEDYGQVAVYRGNIENCPHAFVLDDHHRFVTGKPMLVCGNTAAMVSETRYAAAFTVSGDRSVHYGAFNCGPAVSADACCGGGPAVSADACCGGSPAVSADACCGGPAVSANECCGGSCR